MNMDQTLDAIRQAKLFSDRPVFSREQVAAFEKHLSFVFPEGYLRLVTQLEPELVNFYFEEPYRHKDLAGLVVFARWNDDQFAFHQSKPGVTTILDGRESGKSWTSFEEWLLYVWSMSNRPVNPE